MSFAEMLYHSLQSETDPEHCSTPLMYVKGKKNFKLAVVA